MSLLRYAGIAIGALGIAGLFGSQIMELESIKRDGKTVLLDLRPRDPRALLLGDYMALRYQAEIPRGSQKNNVESSGQFTLALDKNNVGRFVRVSDGTALATYEVRINYIRRNRGVTFGAPRYYFRKRDSQDL